MHRNLLIHPERTSKVKSRFDGLKSEVLLFLDMKNIRYLTGFTGSDGALIIGERERLLLVDGRYTNQARRECEGLVEVFEYREKIEGIESIILEGGLKSIWFEPTAMNVGTYLKLKEKLEGVSLNPIPDAIASIREIKDEAEIACIQKAAEISSQALTAVLGFIKPGVQERDIAIELEYQMGKCGAADASFATIVASGTNSAQPHASPGSRKIQNGDIVMIDYGAVYCGYHSDETCTFVVGRGDDKQKEVYALVKEAHDRALQAVKAGVSCKEIDRIARECIEQANLGKYFSHGTGHGVGLDVHEAPRIAAQSENILEEGMVVTIEPGIYIPDLWGIRIEDMAVVHYDGVEVLTKVPKDYIELQ